MAIEIGQSIKPKNHLNECTRGMGDSNTDRDENEIKFKSTCDGQYQVQIHHIRLW